MSDATPGVFVGVLKNWIAPMGLALGVAHLAQGLSFRPTPVDEGQMAPALELRALDGTEVRLDELRGRTVVLNFWATWCGPCKKEIPWFGEVAAEHPHVEFVGVAVDSGSLADLRRSREELGIRYPIYEASPATQRLWSVKTVPTTYLIDEQGAVREGHVGLLPAYKLRHWLR